MGEVAKIYMAGCGGMLGEAFHRVFGEMARAQMHRTRTSTPTGCPTSIFATSTPTAARSSFRPDYLFHLGAHTSLEYCEENPDDAYLTNTLAVEHAVHIANALDIPLLYISTAGHLRRRARKPMTIGTSPIRWAIMRAANIVGERFVAANCRRHLICRAGWMMGGGPDKDKKFIQKLMGQLKDGASELKVVDDKLGTPDLHASTSPATSSCCSASELWGIYNMVCDGVTSRLEVAQYLV